MDKDENKLIFLSESRSILINTVDKNKPIKIIKIILPTLVNFIFLLEMCGKGSEMIDCVTPRQCGCMR